MPPQDPGRFTTQQCLLETPGQTCGDQDESVLLQRLVRCGNLGHNITAVAGVGQHLWIATDLTLDATQPLLKTGNGLLGEIPSSEHSGWSVSRSWGNASRTRRGIRQIFSTNLTGCPSGE
jgi:hypothetical protein